MIPVDRDKRKELDRSGRRQGVESAISDIFVPAIGLIVYGIFWRDGNFFAHLFDRDYIAKSRRRSKRFAATGDFILQILS